MRRASHSGFVSLEDLISPARPRYWRSVAEFYGSEEEIPQEQFDEEGVEISGASRRRFLSLMAGSMALAGLTACTRQPTETIMPYVEPPENVIPGKPKYYATAAPVNGIAEGVIVESHLGRPTKVEGNPDHPASLGSTSVHSQACLMDLYDPDRAKEINHLGDPQDWDSFLVAFERAIAPLESRSGDGFRILTETVISPTLGAQIQAVLKKFPAAKWHQFDPAGQHSARAAAQKVFGRPVNTYYKLAEADVVVALDSDFLACGVGSTRYARDFATRRRRGNRLDMNRLYSIESTMTATGGKADHQARLALFGDRRISRSHWPAAPPRASTRNGSRRSGKISQAHKGRSAVIPGDHQPAAVHALAHAMNAALGNVGQTVIYTEPLEIQPVDQIASLGELARDMNAGKVDLLLILGGNPVYNAPSRFRLYGRIAEGKDIYPCRAASQRDLAQNALAHSRAALPRRLGRRTRIRWNCQYYSASDRTALQFAFADFRCSTGFFSLRGAPLTRLFAPIGRGRRRSKDFESWWRKTLHDGMIAGSALPSISPSANGSFGQNSANPSPGLELVFRPDVYMHDGRYANNVWLQELPHPMTKLTWDNAVFLSPRTAKRLGLVNQHHVELTRGARSVRGSVWILPGQPDESITVNLGWGRTHSGRAGNGAGFNAYLLRSSDALWRADAVEVHKLDTPYPLATTQMQQSMMGRDVVVWNTLDGYKNNPDFVTEKTHPPEENLTLYPHWDYRGYAWSMSIDLTACVNCQACVIACQAENNIPVVGKEQVLARRAMHWLRIDTYYEGDVNLPSAYYMPVPCMQCENAPCELVCPVQATNHSSDGLNDMVYNRCVGTRYCSNNCPYKVRRFNFLLFQDWTTETWKMQRNPDVSVRSRGVMEKCTYCVQRIREAEINSREQDRFIRDGEIQTACQQACPTQAIVFGDKNNSGNRVAKLKAEKLNYALFAELNTRPRTTYLAELRNPNPELRGAS